MYIIASPAYPFFSFFSRVANLRLLFLLIDLLLTDLGFGFPAFRVPICADEWRVEEKTMSEGGHQNWKIPVITTNSHKQIYTSDQYLESSASEAVYEPAWR